MRRLGVLVVLVLATGCLQRGGGTLDLVEQPLGDRVQLDIVGAGTGLFELFLEPGSYELEISGDFDNPSPDPMFGSRSFLYVYVYRNDDSPRSPGGNWRERFVIPVHDSAIESENLQSLNVSADDRVNVLIFSSLQTAWVRLEREGSNHTEPTVFGLRLSTERFAPRLVFGEEQITPGPLEAGGVTQRRLTTEAAGTSEPQSIVAGINWFFAESGTVSLRQTAYQYGYSGEAGADGHYFSSQDSVNARLVNSSRATVAFLRSPASTHATTWVNETIAVDASPVYAEALQMFLPVPPIAERVESSYAMAPADERQSRKG